MTPKSLEKSLRTELKVRAYVACGWGLVIMFAMMGIILGRPTGATIGIIASVMWVQLRIIREAFDSLRTLRAMKTETNEPKVDPSSDDDDTTGT